MFPLSLPEFGHSLQNVLNILVLKMDCYKICRDNLKKFKTILMIETFSSTVLFLYWTSLFSHVSIIQNFSQP